MQKVTALALAAALTLGMTASALAGGGGTGSYEWKASFSNASPDSQVATAPASPTPIPVYLWFTGCNTVPSGAGMSAAEMDAVLTNWTSFGFTPANGYLNAGGGLDLLLAVGSCPAGPVVAGSWTFFGTNGKVRLGKSVRSDWAVTVDCDDISPLNYAWPGQMRLVGCGTSDFAATLEDWGNGCTGDPVDSITWGNVKALYR